MCITSRKIGELAKNNDIPHVQGSMRVIEAMEVMDMYETEMVAVECEGDFIGVFSRGDFSRRVIRQNLTPEDTILYEVITLNPPSLEAEATLKEAYELMLKLQCEHMPVVSGDKLCGIVHLHDLGKDVMKSLEEAKNENEMIVRYIQGGESYAMANYGILAPAMDMKLK